MRAAVLHGKEDLRIETLPMPVAGGGELIVAVHAALTCGTDLKVFRRGYHARMSGLPPLPFGHELAGVVAQVGKDVSKFREGDRVVALNSAPCDECFYCRHGQQNLCADLLFNNGAYAEYIRIPARIVEKNTLHIPEEISFEHAALCEPLACVVRGLEESRVQPGETMAVIGAGPIGLMFVHCAAAMGVKVIAVVKRDEQVELARGFGAARVVQTTTTEDPVQAVRDSSDEQRGPDVVIEAAGTPLTWQWAVDMVRKGGRVNFFGGCAAGTKVELDTNRLHYHDITLQASFHHTPATCRRAFELISSGSFRAAEFITDHASLEDVPAVLRRLMNRSSDIKTAILP